MSDFDQQLKKVREESGFIAALDQSGGSTPKALGQYGVCLLYTSPSPRDS